MESALFTILFAMSSVGSATRGLESSLEVALERVGRCVFGWVDFTGGGCGEDSRVCEVMVFERVEGVGGWISEYLSVCVCATYVEVLTYGFQR
jgi:hypothetical protein